jgi:Ca-activated chloride channel homolog
MLTLLSMTWAAAPSASAQEPDTIRSGTLLFEVADGDAMEVPRVRTEVRVEVTGAIAHVEVRQRFRNPSELWAGAVYAFPLPQNAVLDHLRTEVNQRVQNEPRRQVDARQLYAQARNTTADLTAASSQGLLVQAPLAEISPHAVIDVTISYLQVIEHHSMRHHLRVPLAANPGPSVDLDLQEKWPGSPAQDISFMRLSQMPPPTAELPQTPEVSVQVSIAAGRVTEVSSLNHLVSVTGTNQGVVITSTASEGHRDFELTWLPATSGVHSLTPESDPTGDQATALPFSPQPVSLRQQWEPLSGRMDTSGQGFASTAGRTANQTWLGASTFLVSWVALGVPLLFLTWMTRDWRRWKIRQRGIP